MILYNLYKIKFENLIKQYIKCNYPNEIEDKIQYMITGGKYLRGILGLIFGFIDLERKKDKNNEYIENEEIIINNAILIELIHNISLVLDDTPIMDNDIIRRKKESFFKKYGYQYTLFYFYYMMNKIIILSGKNILDIKFNSNNIHLIINNYTNCMTNLLQGQITDINYNNENNINNINTYDNNILNSNLITENIIEELINDLFNIKILEHNINSIKNNIILNINKTGILFLLPIYSSIILIINYKKLDCNTKEVKNLLDKIIIWSLKLGIVFQYSDDLLDIEQDKINNKPNIANIISSLEVKNLIKDKIIELRKESFSICDICCKLFDKNINIFLINDILEKINNRIK